MKWIKPPTPALLLSVLVLAGVISALTGIFLLLGLAATLIVGGVLAVVAGLTVDV